MAWDTARTRQLLLDAAVEEFAEHGPQGARVDRVAAKAGVNKERIYQYFGNKDQLFGAVLTQELERLAAAVPLDAAQAADLGQYAGRVFDYHGSHPHLVRLLHWEGLHAGDAEVPAEAARTAHYAGKVAALAAAQEEGTLTGALPPADLVYAVIALAGWWFSTPQLARMIRAGAPDDSPAARREALVRLVRALVA
ncbi:TetR/AcrR family transcriptional regulator [Nonomuraea sp. SMC257]|uniref:TetR/AcrR family transcriptional regulator n=1 Tax=Nonomuraea montanisoli TaxID=2741721 RepID=A0A7Y6IF12_9ACTN|nr:TetR family transcriptional regulator [Nonomuraea montanisoli]NUW37018.1 TetR/AcrR family transcriptional regulator [Nonomuraea montanisoli]